MKADIRLVPDGNAGVGATLNDKKDNTIYDLQGRKVNGSLRKGVYIQEGRKELKN